MLSRHHIMQCRDNEALHSDERKTNPIAIMHSCGAPNESFLQIAKKTDAGRRLQQTKHLCAKPKENLFHFVYFGGERSSFSISKMNQFNCTSFVCFFLFSICLLFLSLNKYTKHNKSKKKKITYFRHVTMHYFSFVRELCDFVLMC